MRITQLITKREIAVAVILNQVVSTILKRNVCRSVLENLYVDLGLKGKINHAIILYNLQLQVFQVTLNVHYSMQFM